MRAQVRSRYRTIPGATLWASCARLPAVARCRVLGQQLGALGYQLDFDKGTDPGVLVCGREVRVSGLEKRAQIVWELLEGEPLPDRITSFIGNTSNPFNLLLLRSSTMTTKPTIIAGSGCNFCPRTSRKVTRATSANSATRHHSPRGPRTLKPVPPSWALIRVISHFRQFHGHTSFKFRPIFPSPENRTPGKVGSS